MGNVVGGDHTGSQECGLLKEYYEEQPSACKTVWHRQLLRAIFGSWRDQNPLEAMLPGQGKGAATSAIGSSRWQKHRGGLLDEAQWDITLKDLKDRQQIAVERVKEIRQQYKRQRLEQATVQLRQQRSKRRQRIKNGSPCSTGSMGRVVEGRLIRHG